MSMHKNRKDRYILKERKETISLNFNLFSYLYSKRVYLWAFLIPALVILVAYIIFGVNPWAHESVLVLDLNGQYVYYYENLRDAFYGNGSLLNSFSRNLSGEIIGMFAYYLASPFSIIVLLFPRAYITEAILVMQLCKVGAASVAMCHYLGKHRGLHHGSLIFSVIYALMAYMVVQLMDPMWLDGLILLPLICKGIEKLVDNGKMLYFIIPLTLMFIANFYIGWMVAIFSVLYFLAYFFAISKSECGFVKFLVSGSKFAVGGVLSAACAAWLLIPLYFSLSLGKFEFTDPNFAMKTQFDFIDFFVNLLPNVYDTCRPEGSPVVYCGVLTIILVPLYFLNNNITLRQKIGYGILTLSIILSMYMSTVDIVWHGLQVPNWLPYRYSFMFSFLLIVMAAQAFERIEGISYKEIGVMFFLLAFYVLYVDKMERESVTLLATVWFTVLFGAVYAFTLYCYKKFYEQKPVNMAFIFIIIVELLISSCYTMFQIDEDVVYSKRTSYNRYITLGRNTVQKIYDMDNEPFYRIESNYHRTVNDAMAFGSYGVSHSSSTLNAGPIELLHKLGFSYGGHYIKYKGSTYVTDALFGIRYVMEKGSVPKPQTDDDGNITEEASAVEVAKNKHYNDLVLANGDNTDILYVYKNPYALPLGFMADSDIADVVIEGDNPFESQNKLMQALTGDNTELFHRIEIDEILTENAKPSTYGTHTKYTVRVEGENSHIEHIFTAPTSDMIYMYLPSSYERKVNVWLNHDFLDYYFEGGNEVIQTLGRFAPGEEISLITTIASDKNEVLFADRYFYYLDEAAFKAADEKLKQHPWEIETFEEDYIKGSVTADKDGILFTTISWEPGWKILVDGVETEPVQIAEALIGIPVTKGTHTVEMKFFPKGMTIGIIISAAALIVIVMIGIMEKRREKVMLSRLYEL